LGAVPRWLALVVMLPLMVVPHGSQTDQKAGPANSGQAASEEDATMGDKEKILAILARFVEAWNANDAERAVLVYSDPHFDINASPQREDRATTEEKFREYFANYETQIDVSSEEILLLGEMAVQRGEFVLTSTPRDGGDTEVLTRRYMELLTRDPSGNWSVFWAMDGPLAATASPD
jgi:ketosteroid isomerase-like protein